MIDILANKTFFLFQESLTNFIMGNEYYNYLMHLIPYIAEEDRDAVGLFDQIEWLKSQPFITPFIYCYISQR